MKKSKTIISLLAVMLCGTLYPNSIQASNLEEDQSTQVDFFSEYKGQVVETTNYARDTKISLPEQYSIPNTTLFNEKNTVNVLIEENVLNDGSILNIYSRKGVVETEDGIMKYSEVYFDDNRAVFTYYCENWNYIRQDYYENGIFIESNNRSLENQLSNNVIKLTDVGWGYAFHPDYDNNSFSCPQSVLDARPSSHYKRLNIEVPYSVETNTQEDFLDYTNDLARAEQELDRSLANTAYDTVIGLLEDVLGSTLGDLARAVAEVKGLCDDYEDIANNYLNCKTIAETNTELFECYDILVRHDVLD